MSKIKFMDWPFLLFLFFGVIGPVGTKVYIIYNHVLYNEPFTWMDTQPKLNPQETYEGFSDGIGMQNKVEGSVATNTLSTDILAEYKKEDLNQVYANPLAVTAENLAKGQKYYGIYCTMCHGDLGDGADTGTLRGGHFSPPSFHSQKLKDATDGHFYQVIVNGQNSMPSYAKQISVDKRWAIVQYVRALQRAKDAKKADLDVQLLNASNEKEEIKKDEGHH